MTEVSVLVPFRADTPRDRRIRTWRWLKQRWEHLLPEAEIVEGTTDSQPFSKSQAVNDAYSKATGDVLVIADADSWIERPQVVLGLEQAAQREHLVVPWFIGYRFTEPDSDALLALSPDTVLPVTRDITTNAAGTGPAPDSAAMVVCIQRSAFERVGGFDPRFLGWGSEDVSFSLACWTLLGRTEFCIGEAYALYHDRPMLKTNRPDKGWSDMRVWKNDPGALAFDLWHRYKNAQGYPERMLSLCQEHPLPGAQTPISLSPTWSSDDMIPFQDVKEAEGATFHTPTLPLPDQRGAVPVARETLY